MPFNNIPAPFETSSAYRRGTGGQGYNTWVEPATGLVGPRPGWKEIAPRLTTVSANFRPCFIIPFQPINFGSDAAVNGVPASELVVGFVGGVAGIRPRGYTYSPVNLTALDLTAVSAGPDIGISVQQDRLKTWQRTALAPDGISAWAVVGSNSTTDNVLYVSNGVFAASAGVAVTLVPGLPACRIQGIAFAGGRVFVLAMESSTGRPIIHASAVGGATFTGGYSLILSLNPDSASIFTGGTGILALDNRRLLVYGSGTTLVYSIASASLTLENSIQGVGTMSEGGCITVGDRALMLSNAGPIWISLEVLRDNFRPEVIGGSAGELATEWYKKVNIEPGRHVFGAWRAPGYRLVSHYSAQWNCVFFSAEHINETLYMFLGDDTRPPYTSIWNTSWSKAWEVERKITVTAPGTGNYRPMMMYRDYNGDGSEGQLVGLTTTEFYAFQGGVTNSDAAPFLFIEAPFDWYMVSPPIPLGDKDSQVDAASIRQTSLNIYAFPRRGGTDALSPSLHAYWITQRNGNTGSSQAGYLTGAPAASSIDLVKARQQVPTSQDPYESALLAFNNVRIPYSSANGRSPRLVIFGASGGSDIINIGSVDVTWQPIKHIAASF